MTNPTGPTTDVIDELTTDHREMKALLASIARTTDPQARRDMADTVITELVRHAVAEEMYVYPAISEYLPDGEQDAEHDAQEHKQIERTLKQLEAADASEPRFMKLIDELTRQLDHHIEEEERNQFPQLRARVPRQQLIELREKVDTAKKIAPTRPHPNAPNSELFHKLVGPGVGLIDRVRDKLTGRG